MDVTTREVKSLYDIEEKIVVRMMIYPLSESKMGRVVIEPKNDSNGQYH